MKLKSLVSCGILMLSSNASAAVISFAYGHLEGQPYAVGYGSFTISDVYSPNGRYDITAVDADIGYLLNGGQVYTHTTTLPFDSDNYIVAHDLRSPADFYLSFELDGRIGRLAGFSTTAPAFGGDFGISRVTLLLAGELPQPAPPPPPAAVPEPSSWAMLVAGFGLIGGALRQRRRANLWFA